MRSIIFAAVLATCGGAFALPASAVPAAGALGTTEGQSSSSTFRTAEL